MAKKKNNKTCNHVFEVIGDRKTCIASMDHMMENMETMVRYMEQNNFTWTLREILTTVFNAELKTIDNLETTLNCKKCKKS